MSKILILLTLCLVLGLSDGHRHRDGERRDSRDLRPVFRGEPRGPSRDEREVLGGGRRRFEDQFGNDNRLRIAIPIDRRERGFGWGPRPIFGGRRHDHGRRRGGCQPVTVEPTTARPTTVEPTTIEPTTVEPTTV